jgi:hypothetical protein
MMLLLSSAIADYKKILELEKTYDVFIHAASWDELKMVIEELVPTRMRLIEHYSIRNLSLLTSI